MYRLPTIKELYGQTSGAAQWIWMDLCVQRMWSDFLADDYVPNGKCGIPLAYTFHMVFPNVCVCVFLTLAPLDVFVGKSKNNRCPLAT